jgi:hypothetical protein
MTHSVLGRVWWKGTQFTTAVSNHSEGNSATHVNEHGDSLKMWQHCLIHFHGLNYCTVVLLVWKDASWVIL